MLIVIILTKTKTIDYNKMNNKFLILVIILGFFLIYDQLQQKSKEPFVYLSPQDKILEEKIYPDKNEGLELISFINQKSAEISSVYSKNVRIYFKQGNGPRFRVLGEFAIQKDKNFRLIVSHKITGKEMDLGSNAQVFWFWNKRMDPPYLHFSKHENLNKTNLKTVLNPIWLMESFGIFPIDFKDAEISKYKNLWFVKNKKVSSLGQQIKYVILLDPKEKKVIGRYLYNSKDELFASSEYRNFDGIIPRQINFIWYEEGINLEINFEQYQINEGIDQRYWSMPSYENTIDIGN